MKRLSTIAIILISFSFSLQSQELLFTSTIGGDKGSGAIAKYNLTTGAIENIYSHDANPLWGGSILKADYDYGGLHMGSDGYIYGLESATTSPLSPSYFSGLLYRFHPDSLNYEVLHEFGAIVDDAFERPIFDLVEVEPGVFYGICEKGGTKNFGGVWKYTMATRTYEEIGAFNIEGKPGNHPASSLTVGPNGDLYGTLRRVGDTYLSGVSRKADQNGRFTREVLDPYSKGRLYKVNLSKDSLEVVDDLGGQDFLLTHANGGLVYKKNTQRLYGVMRWSIVPEAHLGGGTYAYMFNPDDPIIKANPLYPDLRVAYRAQITFDQGSTLGQTFTNMLEGNNGLMYVQSTRGAGADKGSLIKYDANKTFSKVFSFPYYPSEVGTMAAGDYIVGTYDGSDIADGLWIHNTFGGGPVLTNAISRNKYGDVQPYMAFDGYETLYLRTRLSRESPGNQGFLLKYNLNSKELTVLDTLFASNGRFLKGELDLVGQNKLIVRASYGGGGNRKIGHLGPTSLRVDLDNNSVTQNWNFTRAIENDAFAISNAVLAQDGNRYQLVRDAGSFFGKQNVIVQVKTDGDGNLLEAKDLPKLAQSYEEAGFVLTEYDSLKFLFTSNTAIVKYDVVSGQLAENIPKYNTESIRPNGGLVTVNNNDFYGLSHGFDGSTRATLYHYDLTKDTVTYLYENGLVNAKPNLRPALHNNVLYWIFNEPNVSKIFSYDLSSKATTSLSLDKKKEGSEFLGQLTAYQGKLYGVSYNGGTHGLGALIEFDPGSNTVKVLKQLTSENGMPMASNLLLVDQDQDGDGVTDPFDHCFNTPSGEAVDANGCSESQKDDDGDGVANDADQCPNSPKNETVDANGCAPSQRDTDGDGLNDKEDHCPNTPAGESVDQYGCSANQNDGDGDGVLNADDQCPNTPAGEAVDANGCSDSQKDTDGDGINDADDHCPNTPAGETVDVHGCSPSQLDGDGDGVSNAVDQCPNTPAGESVDANGCSDSQKDDDGDGVMNNMDQCPNTPVGEAVDANGCGESQKDDDGDGVFNTQDHCPGTAAGATVDVHGCTAAETDGDGDGVLNQFDKCPNTPAGVQVNADGCATSQLDSDNDGVTDDKDLCPNTTAGLSVNADGCADNQIDTDGDGVYDAIDHCNNTPSGEKADAHGCSPSQLDTDNDGVSNEVDKCPSTPLGSTVNADGCSTGQLDSDGDGVTDNMDQCPNTPAGEIVDANGCSDTQKDGDNDGVNDALDHCPNTPVGTAVDANGCPAAEPDGDGDGVPNSTDQCPNTPAGETVDANGCADTQKDTDGDGVENSKDVCPSTPSGEQADFTGCSPSQLDSDNDGVHDDIDHCPNTPSGQAVDAHGCSPYQLDDDGDGVPNITDQCTNTPAGTVVNGVGCTPAQTDSDNDGVTDDKDQCPNTPVGAQVNTNGCATFQLDADNDGVSDAEDHCPNTPRGEVVDIHGCAPSQLDSDGDNVPNNIDACVNTPAGIVVNDQGCPAYSMAVIGKPNFDDTPLGLIATSTFSILNSGSNDGLDISSIETPDGFSVDMVTASINAGESVTITVSFQPTESKDYSGEIIINSPNVSSQSIAVRGTGAVITEVRKDLSPKLISLQPNPTTDYLTIDLNNLTLTDPQILIYDLNGLIKFRQIGFTGRKQVVDVRQYSDGMYLLRITGNEGELIKKFIKQ